MEKVLIEWFEEMCSSNLPINGTLIKEKAIRVAERLKLENFKASNRWLGRFKRRHGLTYKNLCGESASVDKDTVDYWKTESLLRNLEDYKPNDIFNADETGIYLTFFLQKHLLLEETHAMEGRKAKKELLLYYVLTRTVVKSYRL
jgi:hypothetical protein